jgi:hypothetical protein
MLAPSVQPLTTRCYSEKTAVYATFLQGRGKAEQPRGRRAVVVRGAWPGLRPPWRSYSGASRKIAPP